ncbi:hypothetical protein [Bacillus sp. XF8]|uniref:hypothetical protein n=1 Tax=Bacillus sp. XF8 TaxID=2819289 RepID=UPI001AA08913|nr:hypothetical protein [Bacillus sp. XF8]MBO1580245.1 hypothetical protein [Bacillus sp. XF8]
MKDTKRDPSNSNIESKEINNDVSSRVTVLSSTIDTSRPGTQTITYAVENGFDEKNPIKITINNEFDENN